MIFFFIVSMHLNKVPCVQRSKTAQQHYSTPTLNNCGNRSSFSKQKQHPYSQQLKFSLFTQTDILPMPICMLHMFAEINGGCLHIQPQ